MPTATDKKMLTQQAMGGSAPEMATRFGPTSRGLIRLKRISEPGQVIKGVGPARRSLGLPVGQEVTMGRKTK